MGDSAGIPIETGSLQREYIAMPTAAAMVFHEASRGRPPVRFSDDLEEALVIAAGALSRLVNVYTAAGERVAPDRVRPDLTSGKLLCVQRKDLAWLLLMIRWQGLPFALALNPDPHDAPGT